MKLIFTWEEFVAAAVRELTNVHGQLDTFEGNPEFKTRGSYEPDGEAYTFPPHYVEFEVKNGSE